MADRDRARTSNSFRIGAAIAIIAALALITFFLMRRGGAESTPVRIAANLPMSGGLAVYGKSVQRGATLGVEDLKSTDPKGPVLSFDWQDNAGNPQTAVSIMQQQFLGSPDIYLSGVRPQTTAIWDVVSAKGLPHFVWIFEMKINNSAKNNLRTWVNFKVEPQVYLSYVDRLKPRRVAIIYTNIPSYYDEMNKIFLPGLKQRGISDVMFEAYDFDTNDFRALAVKVREFHPDLIVLQGFQSHLVGLVRALRPYSLITDGNTIATYDMLDAASVLGQDEIEGIRFAAPLFVSRADRPEVATWTAKFKKKFSEPPLYTDAFAYDMTMIIHDTARRLKLPATSSQWIEALRATDISGVTGQLKFDEDGSLITPVELAVFHGGKIVPDSK
jgi:branched-chain amino acid transport system substrate-binding protein